MSIGKEHIKPIDIGQIPSQIRYRAEALASRIEEGTIFIFKLTEELSDEVAQYLNSKLFQHGYGMNEVIVTSLDTEYAKKQQSAGFRYHAGTAHPDILTRCTAQDIHKLNLTIMKNNTPGLEDHTYEYVIAVLAPMKEIIELNRWPIPQDWVFFD